MVIIVPKVHKSSQPYSREEEARLIRFVEAELGQPPPPLTRKQKALLVAFWIAGLVVCAVSMTETLQRDPVRRASAPTATGAR